MADTFAAVPLACVLEPDTSDDIDVADITNSLRSLMVRKMGIVRDQAGLKEAAHDVAFWCRYALSREFDSRPGWELQNLLTIARLMIGSALLREESRGVHYRADCPERDDVHWRRHLACSPLLTELNNPYSPSF
jgi:L-aspartate oxidase